MRKLVAVPTALTSLAALAAAQGQVWIVGSSLDPDTDFTQIQPAVNAAADGDVVLVRETGGNPYQGFSVAGKSLTIQGEGAPAVQAGFFQPGAFAPLSISGIGPSQSVTIRNLEFTYLDFYSPADAAFVVDCLGPVVLEDCGLSSWTRTGLVVTDSLSVTLRGCTVSAAGTFWYDYQGVYFDAPGMVTRDSVVFLHETTVQGGPGADAFAGLFEDIPPAYGSHGLIVRGGQVWAQGSEILGGSGGGGVEGACYDGEDGGHAVVLEAGVTGPSLLRVLDSTITAGAAGVSETGCGSASGSAGVDVQLVDGVRTDFPGDARAFAWASPVREGATLDATYVGVPGDLVFLVYAAGPIQGFYFPPLDLVVHFDLVNFETTFRGVLPASGTLTESFAVPFLNPAKDAARVLGQVMYIDASLVDVWTSGPSTTVILDEAIQ